MSMVRRTLHNSQGTEQTTAGTKAGARQPRLERDGEEMVCEDWESGDVDYRIG